MTKLSNIILILSGSTNIYAAYLIKKQKDLIKKQNNDFLILNRTPDNNIKIAELKIGKDTIYNY